MNSLSSTRLTAPLRLSVFVDADNIPATFAPDILRIARQCGAPDLLRAYGNVCKLPAWDEAPGFHLVHSGSGKNAADMLICLDAMERALSEQCEAVLLVSSDQDFTHLAARLRSYGLTVIGAGEAKTPDRFRKACSDFSQLEPEPSCAPRNEPAEKPASSPATELDQRIRDVIRQNCKNPTGLEIALLSTRMFKDHGIKISTLPDKTWRAYLTNRPALYSLDPKGPNAKVRCKPKSCARATT